MAGFLDATAGDRESEYVFNPVIKELVRTEVCPKSLRLLVEKIHILPVQDSNGEEFQTYQLWLSDGAKMIQALLKPELHPFITVGEIGEGSYVELTKYSLARAKRLLGEGEVLYLHIDDIISCDEGNRERNYELLRHRNSPENSPPSTPSPRSSPKRPRLSPKLRISEQDVAQIAPTTSSTNFCDASYQTNLVHDEAVALISKHSLVTHLEKGRDKDVGPHHEEKGQKKRKLELDRSPGPLQSIGTNFQSSPSPSPKRSCLQDPATEITKKSQARKDCSLSPSTPKPLKTISRPLKVTPLADLVGRRAVRGRILDVCVLICFVSEEIIKRKDMPEIRHLRVTDLSTKKRVLFSCCTNPRRFFPPVGTVALLRNVSTHEWDGGSLNAFPRDCADRDWFLRDPANVDGCDVEGLRRLWAQIQQVEDEERLQKEKAMMEYGNDRRTDEHDEI
ncbi:MAG: hypothetical protein MMC33_001396 [Icmadophila ericetorum]|nr:hypothetical protein [Icmadophila ericetorum]